MEEQRLERHAGKVVYEAPAEQETAQQKKEPQHPTLKDVNASMWKHANNLYSKGIPGGARADSRRIVEVKMIQPTRDQIEEFEMARTDMQRSVAPEKLQTSQNMFYSPSEQQLKVILDKNFEEAIETNAIGFCTDPEQAVREGFSKTDKLLICRVVHGPSVRTTNNKLIIKDMRGVQPTFLLTLESPAVVNARKNE